LISWTTISNVSKIEIKNIFIFQTIRKMNAKVSFLLLYSIALRTLFTFNPNMVYEKIHKICMSRRKERYF